MRLAGNGDVHDLAGKDEQGHDLAGSDSIQDLAGNDQCMKHVAGNDQFQHLAGNSQHMTEDDKRIRQLAGKLPSLPPQVGVSNRGYLRNVALASSLCRTK